MIVSELWVYPIKGLGGQQVDSAFATESGFQNDRRFMLIDSESKFVSQRTHPKITRLSAHIKDGALLVQDKHNENIRLEFSSDEIERSSTYNAKVWKSKVESVTFNSYINNWFSEYLGDDVKLVVQKEFANRKRTLPFKKEKIGMSFADGYPFLVLSQASVDDLSKRLGETIDYRQFRANIIVEDCNPFDEDELKSFNLGNSAFRMVKPCKRCPVININQDTGETGTNVTKELVKYRKDANSVIFGMNAANMVEGFVNIKDAVIKL